MAEAFGCWLRDYDGPSRKLRMLSTRWINSLRRDYVKASAYREPKDVYWALTRYYTDEPRFERLVELAYGVYLGKVKATATKFVSRTRDLYPDLGAPSPWDSSV